MNIKDKNKKLAELAGIKTSESGLGFIYIVDSRQNEWKIISPYEKSINGLAQFAYVFLKWPNVMLEFVELSCGCDSIGDSCCGKIIMKELPTQAEILDEILRMNDIKID